MICRLSGSDGQFKAVANVDYRNCERQCRKTKVIIIIIGHTVDIREIELEERKEERGNQSGSLGTLPQKCT